MDVRPRTRNKELMTMRYREAVKLHIGDKVILKPLCHDEHDEVCAIVEISTYPNSVEITAKPKGRSPIDLPHTAFKKI